MIDLREIYARIEKGESVSSIKKDIDNRYDAVPVNVSLVEGVKYSDGGGEDDVAFVD